MTTSPIRIEDTFGGQDVTDVGTLTPFDNVTITDPNGNLIETLTVTLSAAGNGTLGNLDGGTYNATTGVFSDTGTASAVMAALDGLIFTPTYQTTYVPGATFTTTLTVAVTDTLGATGTDNATTIIASDSNSPKPIGSIYGVDYGPTPGTGAAYGSVAQINTDMSYIAEIANTVHLTAATGMGTALTSALAHGLQVIPSVYLTGSATQDNAAIANLVSVLDSLSPAQLAKIPFVDIGSDFLTTNPTQVSYLVQELTVAKAALSPLGVMVTSTETASAYLANQNLVNAVDLLYPTISPFGQGGVIDVGNANPYILTQYTALTNASPNKNVVIAGIGWPSSGTNGDAVGSIANEETFWAQFIQFAAQNKINYFGFEAFDSSSNTNPDFPGSSWGLYTSSDTPKGSMISFQPIPPPLLVGTVAGQQTGELTAISPFSGVTITDPNASQTETVTITLSSTANGTLSNLGSGSYNAGTGVYTVSGTAAAMTSALDGLVFTPAANQLTDGQTFTVTFTIVDSDTAGATATDATTTVNIESLAIAGTVAGRKTTDATPISPFTAVTITDPNASQTETVIVTLSAAGNGSLGNLGTGSYNAGTGVYMVSGTAAAVASAIDGLVFTPTQHLVALGQSFATTFTIADTDTAGSSATDSTTTVVTTAIVIESAGATSLWLVGNEYVIHSATANVTLQLSSSPVTAALLGAWAPIAAQAIAGGYEVAFKNTAAGLYTVWMTDTNGNYSGNLTPSVSGTSLALEQLEPGFQFDLNGDGVTGPTTTVIAVAGPTTLTQIANEYFMQVSGGSSVALQLGGSPVTAALLGTWAPIAAQAIAGGYEVAFKNASSGLYTVWMTDTNGNYSGNLTPSVSGTSLALEQLEPSFQFDLNGDGVTGVAPNPVIESAGATSLWLVGTEYVIHSATANVTLQLSGSPVTAALLGAWAPIAAQAIAGGYEVAFKNATSGLYTVWMTDTNGNYSGNLTPSVSGTSLALEQLEPSFQFDLNGDGVTGPTTTVIAVAGPTTLTQIANEYFMQVSGGSSVTLQLGGSPVTAALLGAWAPIAAQAIAGGYEVAFKNASSGLYTVWMTDTNGNYSGNLTPSVSGTSLALEQLEPSFQFDLNGDGVTGIAPNPVIESAGATSLWLVGTEYVIHSATANVTLQLSGSPVTAALLGAWAPIAAQAIAGGYEVAFKNATSGLYTVWMTDTNGNYSGNLTPSVSGTSLALEQLEPSFQFDLNGDGVTGVAPTTVIEPGGATSLWLVGTEYVIHNATANVTLQLSGSPVTAALLGAWAPIAAQAIAGGYEVAFRNATSGLYTVWMTDTNGNYSSNLTPSVSGTSLALEQLEPSFQFDLNGDGVTGIAPNPVIESAGATSLWLVGTEYVIHSATANVTLQLSGSPVTAALLGAWAPIAAQAITGGYEVAFKNASSGLYTVWMTDTNGNYVSNATGAVSGQSFALEDLEPSFGFDLNGDGRLSTQLITSGSPVTGQSQAVTINLGANTASVSPGLSLSSLTFIGTQDAITLGTGASIVEYAMQPSSGIETVAGFVLGTDELNIDLAGAANSVLNTSAMTLNGVTDIAIASSADPSHGIVLLNVSGGLTAANLLTSHTTFVGGHALIS